MLNKFKEYCPWLRHMRTTAERCANQDSEYVRAKRNPANIPNAYDDYFVPEKKSWKHNRETQFRCGGRGEEHSLFISNKDYICEYALKEHFRGNNIAYKIEQIKEQRRSCRIIYTERVKSHQVPNYVYHLVKYKNILPGPSVRWKTVRRREIKHQAGFKWIYWNKPLDTPRIECYTYNNEIGFNLTWWSDKDIGMDYILKECSYPAF